MEDELKMIKVDYLSNDLLDHTWKFNISLVDKTIVYKDLK